MYSHLKKIVSLIISLFLIFPPFLARAVTENSFNPQSAGSDNDFALDVVWKTNTLTPYDYSGKALPSALSFVTITAIANVPKPDQLIYTWIIDDISSTNDSPELVGKGKNTFTFSTFNLPEFVHKIRVSAQDRSDIAKFKNAYTSLDLKLISPEAYFYIENNNNHNNLAPDTLKFSPGKESSLMVRPFYFNTANPTNLNYAWKFDAQEQQNSGARPEILPLSISSKAKIGSRSNLQLELTNKKAGENIYDRASRTAEIQIIK